MQLRVLCAYYGNEPNGPNGCANDNTPLEVFRRIMSGLRLGGGVGGGLFGFGPRTRHGGYLSQLMMLYGLVALVLLCINKALAVAFHLHNK
jgi:hypothetical protein